MSTRRLPRTVGDLPWIGRPALSALLAHGIDSLAEVAARSEEEIAAMHGVGPKAVEALRAALADADLDFLQDA